MKSIYILLLICISFLTSCSEEKVDFGQDTIKEEIKQPEVYPDFDWDTLKGIFTGQFSDAEIRIVITYISDKNVVGYNVHKGLVRNINGLVDQTQDSVILNMKEPGDNEFDGTFRIAFARNNLKNKGVWIPNKPSLGTKKFSLTRFVPNNDYSEEIKLNTETFAQYFDTARDSLGTYYFEPDGFVKYEYYASENDYETANKDQMQVAKGSWSFDGKLVTIHWQLNTAYPKLKSQFKPVVDSEWYSLHLEGEGRIIYSMYGIG